MIEAEEPLDEAERLAALLAYDVLDTDPEQAYDDLTRIASQICGAPIALVSLVDSERQWFKSKVGLDATETERKVAFCSHAILEPDEVFVVPDAHRDERFHDNPLVTGAPNVRFYAGAPLVTAEGHAMGTLCVIDHVPRDLTDVQVETLRALSRQAISQMELRKHNRELQELGEKIQRANEDLQQFTSIAAHDLREPLRKLSGFSDLLVRDLGDELPPRAGEDLEHIKASAQQMDRLVSALLQLSRAGSGELAREPVSLSDCAALALDAMSATVAARGAQVEIDELPAVDGDGVLLTQVFQNLIGNSIKYCEATPKLRIHCQEFCGSLCVEVEDNGIGMEQRHADRIFEPFKRLHGREAYEGTGIGLAIVRKIVERHGGQIWVASEFGRGSRFRFTLQGMRAPAAARVA